MKILTPERYVQRSIKGEIDQTPEAVNSPTFIKCPHCEQGIVLARTTDQPKKFAIIFGSFVLLINEDEKPDMMAKMFDEIVRPGIFQWIEHRRKELEKDSVIQDKNTEGKKP
jgi:hypothetical protein